MRRVALIIVGIALLLGYVIFGLSRIRFDVDITRLLPEGLKEAEGTRLFLDHYSRQGELIVTLETEKAVLAGEAAEELAEVFRAEVDLVNAVVSRPAWETDEGGEEMLEFIAWAMVNRPSEELEALEVSLAPGAVEKKLEDSLKILTSGISPEEIASLEYDPMGFLGAGFKEVAGSMGKASAFGSSDGTFRVLYVAARNPEVSYLKQIAWIEAMEDVVSRWKESRENGADIEVGFTGQPAYVAEISSGMERDMRNSAIFTLGVIGFIFWFVYRRFRPLLYLISALVVIFLLTLATGGIVFRELSAISIGFASILIGLTVDYGVILFQEARAPGRTVAGVRKSAGRGIVWASLTTAAAFTSLSAGKVPGLAELGILVGAGVLIGAVVMFGGFVYLAVAAGKRENSSGAPELEGSNRPGDEPMSRKWAHGAAWATGVILVGLLVLLAVRGVPVIDPSPSALRPKDSTAQAAMERLIEKLGNSKGIVSLIVAAEDLDAAGKKLAETEEAIKALQEAGVVGGYRLPTVVWPYPDVQKRNLEGVGARLIAERERLRSAVDAAGFEDAAFTFAGAILDRWESWMKSGSYPVWPESYSAKRAISRFLDWKPAASAENGGGVWALGLLRPTNSGDEGDVAAIRKGMDLDGVYLSGGSVLSAALAEAVPTSVFRIFVALSILVFVALVLAFRNARDVILAVTSVGLTIGAMLGGMQLFGISWNFMNLAALLLALGAGLDYSIHILIDLRRHGGDVAAVQKGVGRALLICGISSVAGFGSLAWAANLGLASLGQACSLALAINTAVAVFLLPKAWHWFPNGAAGRAS